MQFKATHYRHRGFVRRETFSIVFLVVLFLVGVTPGKPAKGEDPKAKQETPPNILFIIADDWGTHSDVYGTPWIKTPGFAQVAREGLLFNRAYTPNAKCATSRATILTGRHSWQLEEAGNHLSYFPAKFKSWPEALMEHGWTVGLTGKGWGPGIANDAEGKPRLIAGVPFGKKKRKPPAVGINNNDYAGNFVDFLDTVGSDKPWCFWVGFHEPHRRYEAGVGARLGGKSTSEIDRVPAYWPDDEITRNDMLDYAFEIEHLDSHITRILEELKKRDLESNTLVIVTSDHGMPFPRCKGHAYHDSNHVPLAIRWPNRIRFPGRKVDDYVNFTDIAPTMLDVAGLSPATGGMQPVTGRSWMSLLEYRTHGGGETGRDYTLVGKERHDVGRPGDVGYPIRGILRDDYLYLRNFENSRWPSGNPETGYLETDGSPTKTHILRLGRADRANPFWQLGFGFRPEEELYDLHADPDCVKNLASDQDYAALKKSMSDQMMEILISQQDPRALGKGEIFDSYPVTAGTGFYELWARGEEVTAAWVEKTDFEK